LAAAGEVTHANPTTICHGQVIIEALKLVRAVAGLEKSDSGECIQLASMTPGNTEYPKYDPPGAQISDDALAKVSSIYSTLLAKT
jgi:hypothetical protein